MTEQQEYSELEELLDQMSEDLPRIFMARLDAGKATAADLEVIRKYLNDNRSSVLRDELLIEMARKLAAHVKAGVAKASLLNVTRQFIKDCELHSSERLSSAPAPITEDLPFAIHLGEGKYH